MITLYPAPACLSRRHSFIAVLGLWLVCLVIFSPSSLADTRELEVRPGVIATAAYWPGSADSAPVLILHGFLQTHEFSTVERLAEGLAESDYTVLTPTLSLGITRRRQSQPCEALHLQTLDDDVAELAQWVDWLYRQKQRKIVLVGHSAGGHVITRYLDAYPDAPVEQVILISLSYPLGQPLSSVPHDPGALGEYRLGFCQHYATTWPAFRSYVDWGPDQMIAVMRRLVPRVAIILGTGDRRIKPAWIDKMKQSGVEMKFVQGANHFFDSTHEFDLLDAVQELLE